MASDRFPVSGREFRVQIEGMDQLTGWVGIPRVRSEYTTNHVYTDDGATPVHMPGRQSVVNIALRRNCDGAPDLLEWHSKRGTDLRNGSIIYLRGGSMEVVDRINWEKGQCVSYERCVENGPENDGVLKEVVVIAAEKIVRG